MYHISPKDFVKLFPPRPRHVISRLGDDDNFMFDVFLFDIIYIAVGQFNLTKNDKFGRSRNASMAKREDFFRGTFTFREQ